MPEPFETCSVEKCQRLERELVTAIQEVQKWSDEAGRLRAVVDRLPKTADGVRVVPGMEVVCPTTHQSMDVRWVGSGSILVHAEGDNHLSACPAHNVYNTRAPAEAAREASDAEA